MRGHVGAGRIGDLAEVAERVLLHQAVEVVGVEGAPAVVRGLHPDDPVHTAAHRGAHPFTIGMLHAAQRQHHLGGVVDVRVVVVLELERPTARLEVRAPYGPVPRYAHLLVEQPAGRADKGGIVGRHARVAQRDDRECRVPHGRLAGLEPAAVVLVNRERLEPLERGMHQWVIHWIAANVERHHRVDPGRLDAAPRAVGFLAGDDPSLGPRQREPAQPPERPPLVFVQEAVRESEPAPQRPQRTALDPSRGTAEQLVEPVRQRPHRPVGPHHGEGRHGLPPPAGERVDAHRRAAREEHQLRRQRRDVVPGPDPEQREPDVREDARVLRAAAGKDELARADHVLGVRRVAAQPQRGVGLDRGGQVARRAVEVAPAAVVALLGADPGRGQRAALVLLDAEELAQQQVLGVHRGVGLEQSAPEACGLLQREQVRAGAR